MSDEQRTADAKPASEELRSILHKVYLHDVHPDAACETISRFVVELVEATERASASAPPSEGFGVVVTWDQFDKVVRERDQWEARAKAAETASAKPVWGCVHGYTMPHADTLCPHCCPLAWRAPAPKASDDEELVGAAVATSLAGLKTKPLRPSDAKDGGDE